MQEKDFKFLAKKNHFHFSVLFAIITFSFFYNENGALITHLNNKKN